MRRLRLAVALLVPAPVAAEVDGLRRALRSGALGRIPPHVTLVPPVNVREQDLGAVLERLRGAARGARPFRLTLGPLATFWPRNPVLYLAVGGPGVEALGRLRDALVAEPPLRREPRRGPPVAVPPAPVAPGGPVPPAPSSQGGERPFVPHVTVSTAAPPAQIPAAVSALGGYRAEVTIERVHLLQEGPGEGGAGRVWEPVADARLAAPAVIGRGGLALEVSVTERPDAQAAAWAAAAWASLDRETYGEGALPDRPFAVCARRDGLVLGLAEGHFRGGGVCELSRLIVDASARSEGVGSHLLAAVQSLAAEAGCGSVRLMALAGGRAEGFYRERGWVVSALLPAWREGRDLVAMERRLR